MERTERGKSPKRGTEFLFVFLAFQTLGNKKMFAQIFYKKFFIRKNIFCSLGSETQIEPKNTWSPPSPFL